MPVFLQGRRAFFIIPAPPTSPLQPLISPPRHQFGPRLPAPRLPRCGHLSLLPFLVYPVAAVCRSYPSSSTPLPPPVTPTLTSSTPLRLPPATPTLTLPTSLSPPSDTEAPHGPPPLPLGLKCRHGPRPFCSSARSTDTARTPSAVLRDVAQPIPVPALPGAQKRRTEPHRGPSAAKKQPICRGSITAAALQPVRSVHSPETNPLRIVRAGISG